MAEGSGACGGDLEVGLISGLKLGQVFVVELAVCGERLGLRSGALERWDAGECLGRFWWAVVDWSEGNCERSSGWVCNWLSGDQDVFQGGFRWWKGREVVK